MENYIKDIILLPPAIDETSRERCCRWSSTDDKMKRAGSATMWLLRLVYNPKLKRDSSSGSQRRLDPLILLKPQ